MFCMRLLDYILSFYFHENTHKRKSVSELRLRAEREAVSRDASGSAFMSLNGGSADDDLKAQYGHAVSNWKGI